MLWGRSDDCPEDCRGGITVSALSREGSECCWAQLSVASTGSAHVNESFSGGVNGGVRAMAEYPGIVSKADGHEFA